MKRRKAMAGLAALILAAAMVCAAAADTLLLPADLQQVEDAAFAGTAITDVVIPAAVKTVGRNAFVNSVKLRHATVLGADTQIGEDCFEGCADELLIICPPESAALTYAQENQLDYAADTVCRALVICQTYEGTPLATITGTGNDAEAVRSMLSQQTERPFAVNMVKNAVSGDILSAVASTFADATDRDISLFYYLGHGGSDGSLIGPDWSQLQPARLKAAMEHVAGRKIIIIDACYSGHFLEDEAAAMGLEQDDGQGAAAFTSAFMQAFAGGLKSRAAVSGDTWLIVSAAADEECYETTITSNGQKRVMGLFTFGLCYGCGWDGVTQSARRMAADLNSSGSVSIAEAYAYARAYALSWTSKQNAQSNGADCRWFAPFR